MGTLSPSDSLTVSIRFYRRLLAAYPKKFREHYETPMVQVFRDSLRDAYRLRRIPGVVELWLHTGADLLVTALIERISEGSQHMFSPRVVVWGGVAAAFGGLMWLTPPLAQGGNGTAALVAALVLTLGGLAALHARQGKAGGALSSAGFALGIFGTALILLLFARGPADIEHDPRAALQFLLGMGILGIGSILMGLRALQTGIPSRPTAMLSLVIGVLQAGFGLSVWLIYYLASTRGIDPWTPISAPAVTALLLTLVIGILWIALGAMLAQSADRQTSSRPPAAA